MASAALTVAVIAATAIATPSTGFGTSTAPGNAMDRSASAAPAANR